MLSALVLAILPGLLLAQEQQFAFALPEREGRISLGVFDPGGTLVRTLFVGAAEGDFQVGLNGLIATWDGKNDEGKAVAAGTYRIRGYVVGSEVKAEGEAFHFNDWIVDDTTPAITGIGAVVPGENDAFLLFGVKPARNQPHAADSGLWRFDESEGLQTVASFPDTAGFLTGDSARIAMDDRKEGKLLLYDLTNPSGPRTAAATGLSCGAFWKDRLALASGKTELEVFDPATLTPEKTISTPVAFQGLDANAAALVGRDAAGVWLSRVEKFEPAPLKELPENFTLSAGPGETFWIAGQQGSDIIVRQHAFDGELLRQMKITEAFAETVQIFASKTSLRFYLLLHSKNRSRQTLRGYRPANSPTTEGPTQVDWEVFLDKTIENSRRFGFVDGKLVPDAGQIPQDSEQEIPLLANTLNARGSRLTLRAASGPTGLWLQTAEGLPLLALTGRKFIDRTVAAKGGTPDSLRVFAGDGVVVSAYLVTGVENIAAIEAGEIVIP